MPALRQPPNIRQLLCRSKLFPVLRGNNLARKCKKTAPGWKKCSKGSNTCCPFALPATEKVTSNVTGYQHTIKDAVDCQTSNCIYYWKCKKTKCKEYPRCEYVGMTSRPYRTRLSEHKQYIRSQLLDKPSGYHFNQPGHSLSDLTGLVLEHVKSPDPFILKTREYFYIHKIDTYNNGLNKEPRV